MALSEEAKLKYVNGAGLAHYDGLIKNYTNTKVSDAVAAQAQIDAAQDSKINALEEAVESLEAGAILGHTQTISNGLGESLAAWNGSVNQSLSFELLHEGGKIKLQIGDGTSSVISEISDADFIKDGLLQSAEIITIPTDENPDGYAAGRYIKLTWNTDAGIEATYIAVADLISEHDVVAGTDTAGTYVKTTTSVVETTGDDGQKVSTVSTTVDDSVLVTKFNTLESNFEATAGVALGDKVKIDATTEDTYTIEGALQALNTAKADDTDVVKTVSIYAESGDDGGGMAEIASISPVDNVLKIYNSGDKLSGQVTMPGITVESTGDGVRLYSPSAVHRSQYYQSMGQYPGEKFALGETNNLTVQSCLTTLNTKIDSIDTGVTGINIDDRGSMLKVTGDINLPTGNDVSNGDVYFYVNSEKDGPEQFYASVKGLGTAAYTDSTAYATAAQGALADTAVQETNFKTTIGLDSGSLWQSQANNVPYDIASALEYECMRQQINITDIAANSYGTFNPDLGVMSFNDQESAKSGEVYFFVDTDSEDPKIQAKIKDFETISTTEIDALFA